MLYRQILLFKPDSKLTVGFTKSKTDLSQLYDVNDNKEETASVKIEGVSNPTYEETL